MNRSTEIEVKVGIFVSIGLGLVMITILMLGGGQSIFSRGLRYKARFEQIEGVIEGATVKMAGVKIGQVSSIKFVESTGQVDIELTVDRKFKYAIHQDSAVGVATQGMLGDRYIVVSTGTPGSPPAEAGAELKSEAPKDIKEFLSDADEVLGRLKSSLRHMEGILGSFSRENRAEIFFKNITGFSSNAIDGTRNLKFSMERFSSIMSKIDKGEGTIGALVNDPSLYDDLKALLGGANRNRVLKYFIKKSVEESRDAAAEADKQQKKP